MAGKYKRIYIGIGTTLIGLFTMLTLMGLQIVDTSGDIMCAGTIEDPCISYFEVRNPTAKSIYIYNYDEVQLDFSPDIKGYELYVKYYGKWHYTNFTKETRFGNIPADRKYSFVFPRYSIKKFKLVGYKNNPEDDVKWGVGTSGAYLDPLWEGIKKEKENITIPSKREISISSTDSWFISSINDTELGYDVEDVTYNGDEFKFTVKINESHSIPKELPSIKVKDYNKAEIKESINFYKDYNKVTGKKNYAVSIPHKYENIIDGNISIIDRKEVILKLGENSIYVVATLGTDLTINVTTPVAYNMTFDVSECNIIFNSSVVDNLTSITDTACTFNTVWNSNNSYIFEVPETQDIISVTPTYVSIEGVRGNNGLVASYSFDYDTGSVLFDSSGNGNDGTITNAVWSTDTHNGTGSSLSFDGDGDYVDISSVNLQTANPYSVCIWAYNIESGESGAILSDWGSLDSFTMLKRTDERLQFEVQTNGTDTSPRVLSTTYLNVNEWYHICGAVNYVSKELEIYVNGTQENTASFGNDTILDNVGYAIGRRSVASTDWHFNGTIESVNIYNYALSATEIADHYTNGLTRFTNITDGMNTTNSDWFGQETVSVTSEYADEQNLTRVRISNPYAMNQYDLLSFNLSSYLGWGAENILDILDSSYYSKNTSDYTIYEDHYPENDTNLELWMNFNELDGTIAKDRTSNNNDGTLTNMNTGYNNGSSGWTTDGKVNNAIDFDGTNDYVQRAMQNLNGSDEASMSVWFKSIEASEDQGVMGWLDNSWKPQFLINRRADNLIRFRVSSFISDKETDSISTVNANEWVYVVVVIKASQYQAIYINGNLDINDTTDIVDAVYTQNSDFYIGRMGEKDYYFNGSIDEVRIWSEARTPAQILASYNEGLERLNIMPKEEGGLTASEDWDIFVSNGTMNYFPHEKYSIAESTGTTFYFYATQHVQTEVEPQGQTSTLGMFTVENNLTYTVDIYAILNETNTGVTLKLDDTYNYSDSVSINTSYQLIYDNLAVDATDYIWVWADFNNLQTQWNPELDIVAVKS